MQDNLKKRKIKNFIALSLACFCAAMGVFWLGFILFDVIREGVQFINMDLFLQDPAPPGLGGGGLRNAFVGQLMIILVATVVGVPLGILGGTFLAEYGRNKRFANILSTIADIMISIPAIVVGTFIYAVVVKPMGHFSGWAGGISLAIIMFPIVVRTTEDMMRLVPDELREAAFALGAPYYKVIIQVIYRGAATGILTGVLLAIARVAGEAAPLLFTSFNNAFFTMNLNEPTPSLTVTIFQYAMGPYDDWHRQAWAASLIITVAILMITVIGRVLIKWRYKR